MPLPNVTEENRCTADIKPRITGTLGGKKVAVPLVAVFPKEIRGEILNGQTEFSQATIKAYGRETGGSLVISGIETRRCKNIKEKNSDVCKFHGAEGGRPPVTGAYSQYGESLDKKMERALSHTELKKLDQEIILMRGVLQELLEAIKNSEEKNIFDSKELLKVQTTADSVRKLVETHAKIEEQERITMSLTKLDLLGAQMLMIVKEALTSFLTIVEEKTDMSFVDEFTKVLVDTGVKLRKVKIIDGET